MASAAALYTSGKPISSTKRTTRRLPTCVRRGGGGSAPGASPSPRCPLLPDVEHPHYFQAEIDRVRASLSEEERALPEYDAGNHEAWAAYFKHRKAERLASINNTPLVRGRNNSDGCRMW